MRSSATGSFTKVSETQYTVMVTPSLGGKHSNVGITVAANTFTDVVGNTNTTILIKGGCIKKCFLCITCMRHIPMG
jgi:hypothetical protein